MVIGAAAARTTAAVTVNLPTNAKIGPPLCSARFACKRGFKSKPSTQITGLEAQSRKVGCSFKMRASWHAVEGHGILVQLSVLSHHKNHVPGSKEDLKWLGPDPFVCARALYLLEAGCTSHEVRKQINAEADAAAARARPASGGYMSHIQSARRQYLSKNDVHKLQKQRLRNRRVDDNDVAAVHTLMQELGQGESACVVYYQPQTVGADGAIEQHLNIILSSTFQQRMLRTFGSRLVLMDSTGGICSTGYPLYVMLVVDDHHNGVPVGFMITSDLDAAPVTQFVTRMLAAAGVTPKDVSFMIDKSRVEMAALREAGVKDYLLCLFHMLQDWERYLRSSESGVGSSAKDLRTSIMGSLRELARHRDKDRFLQAETEFLGRTDIPQAVKANYRSNWQDDASHWARYGRADLKDLNIDTNNHLERFMGVLKTSFMDGRKACTVADLIHLLVTKVMPYYARERQFKISGLECGAVVATLGRFDKEVAYLIDNAKSGAITASMPDVGLATVTSLSVDAAYYTACVADMSCGCPANQHDVCKHVAAASSMSPLTHCARQLAAEIIVDQGWLVASNVDDPAMMTCRSMACASKKYGLNTRSWFCTCHDWHRNSTCAHLLAAALMEAEAPIDTTTAASTQPPATSLAAPAAIFAPDPPADIHAALVVSPFKPYPLPAGVPDPLGPAPEAEINSLTSAIEKASSAAPKQVADDQKEWKNTAQQLMQLHKHLPSQVLMAELPALKGVLAAVKPFVNKFIHVKPQGEQKSWTRKHNMKTMPALNNKKKKPKKKAALGGQAQATPAAVAGQDAGADVIGTTATAFKQISQAGRPRKPRPHLSTPGAIAYAESRAANKRSASSADASGSKKQKK